MPRCPLASPKRLGGLALYICPTQSNVVKHVIVEATEGLPLPASILPSVSERQRTAEQLDQGGESRLTRVAVEALDRHGGHP